MVHLTCQVTTEQGKRARKGKKKLKRDGHVKLLRSQEAKEKLIIIEAGINGRHERVQRQSMVVSNGKVFMREQSVPMTRTVAFVVV